MNAWLTAGTTVPVYLDASSANNAPDASTKCGRNTQPTSRLHTRGQTNMIAAIRERSSSASGQVC